MADNIISIKTGDVIDITDAVEKARSSFVLWSTNYLYGLEIMLPGMSWTTLPIVSGIVKQIIYEVLTSLSKSSVMTAFFFSTAIRKAGQVQDFVDAVNAKNSLPENVTDAEYEKYERIEIAAFAAFVSISN